MKIIVEGHEIETKEIVSIKEAGSGTYGFIINLIGPRSISITEREDYNTYNHVRQTKNARYKTLQNKVEEQWNKDKSDLIILNL